MQNPVRFIRKGGRVIPIRGKVGNSSWRPGGSSYKRSISQAARHQTEFETRRTKNMLIGAVAGGILGVGGPIIGAGIGAGIGALATGYSYGKARKGESSMRLAKRMALKSGTTG